MSSIFLSSGSSDNLDNGTRDIFVNKIKLKKPAPGKVLTLDSLSYIDTRLIEKSDCNFSIVDGDDFVEKKTFENFEDQINQKIDDLEQKDDVLENDIGTINGNLVSINSNLNTLNSKTNLLSSTSSVLTVDGSAMYTPMNLHLTRNNQASGNFLNFNSLNQQRWIFGMYGNSQDMSMVGIYGQPSTNQTIFRILRNQPAGDISRFEFGDINVRTLKTNFTNNQDIVSKKYVDEKIQSDLSTLNFKTTGIEYDEGKTKIDGIEIEELQNDLNEIESNTFNISRVLDNTIVSGDLYKDDDQDEDNKYVTKGDLSTLEEKTSKIQIEGNDTVIDGIKIKTIDSSVLTLQNKTNNLSVVGANNIFTGQVRTGSTPTINNDLCNKAYVDSKIFDPSSIENRVTQLENHTIKDDEAKDQEIISKLKAVDFESENVSSYDTVIKNLDENYVRIHRGGDIGPYEIQFFTQTQRSFSTMQKTHHAFYFDGWMSLKGKEFGSNLVGIGFQLQTSGAGFHFCSRSYLQAQGDGGVSSRTWTQNIISNDEDNFYFLRSRQNDGQSPGGEADLNVQGKHIEFNYVLQRNAETRMYKGTIVTLPDNYLIINMTISNC